MRLEIIFSIFLPLDFYFFEIKTFINSNIYFFQKSFTDLNLHFFIERKNISPLDLIISQFLHLHHSNLLIVIIQDLKLTIF